MSPFFWLYRGNDLTSYFLPEAEFFSQSIRQKIFPVWNPWIMAGYPYLMDPQNYLWYPPNYIFLFLPAEVGFFLLLIAHLLFAGWVMTKLLSKFPRWIKLLGALLFVLSPKLVAHFEEGNWSLLIADTWLPFLLWSLRRKRLGWVALALAAIIINNLNIGYYASIFTVIFLLLNLSRDRIREMIMLFSRVVVLTLPRTLPLMLYGNQTVRSELVGQALPFWSWTKIAKSLILPLGQGHPGLQNEEILYLGVIPITLLVWKGLAQASHERVGQALRKLSREYKIWLGWTVFLVMVALNTKTLFFPVLQMLPGFSLLRITTRPWIFISLIVALTVPAVVYSVYKSKAWLAYLLTGLVMIELLVFSGELFGRRIVPTASVPIRLYDEMSRTSSPVRAYCTTGCLDRLTAQRRGIALLGGNNPVQLRSFVNYLQQAGGYTESEYHPILPPYTTFSSKPQPSARLLAQTATKYVVSPYILTDPDLMEIGRESADSDTEYYLYINKALPISASKLIESKTSSINSDFNSQ